MSDLDAIAAINVEQLATATDRLLIHRGRMPKYRAAAIAATPERTVFMRTRARGFDRTTLYISSAVSGAFAVFAALAVLV